MPIYEYACQDCGAAFEMIRPISQADASAPCTACGSARTYRKLSLFFAESGGQAVSGMRRSACGSCHGGHCSQCGL